MSELISGNSTREAVIYREGQDSLRRYRSLMPVFKGNFSKTALTEERPWTYEDVQITRRSLTEAAQVAHPKVGPSYWEHLILASIYGRKIAEVAGLHDLNPLETEALLLLHDVGRLVIPHRYLRNDLIADRLLTKVGLRREFLQKQTNMLGILGLSSGAYHGLEDVPLPQRVIDVADNIGKNDKDGNLFDIESMIHYDMAQPTRYTAGVWPCEDAGKKALVDGKQVFATELVLKQIMMDPGICAVPLD